MRHSAATGICDVSGIPAWFKRVSMYWIPAPPAKNLRGQVSRESTPECHSRMFLAGIYYNLKILDSRLHGNDIKEYDKYI